MNENDLNKDSGEYFTAITTIQGRFTITPPFQCNGAFCFCLGDARVNEGQSAANAAYKN